MSTPLFHELKKQASFFFREKMKTARLALTDVTPAQLLTEEATNGNPWAPDTRSLKMISKAAFEVDDYWRIVEILHKRLVKIDKKNWRLSYKALIVMEHLLTHGPESVAEEFQGDKNCIWEMGSFQYVDEKGFNWGLAVRKKSERILKLLEKGPLLKEERDRARKLTRGIEGFGSFCQRNSSTQEFVPESPIETFGRCNSQYTDHGNQEDEEVMEGLSKTELEKPQPPREENVNLVSNKKMEKIDSGGLRDAEMLQKFDAEMSFKENMAPSKEDQPLAGELNEWNSTGESMPLLGGRKDDPGIGASKEDQPFSDGGHQTTVSLLSTEDQALQACWELCLSKVK